MANKDVRDEMRLLVDRFGFEWAGDGSDGHHLFVHSQYGEITLPSTPRGSGWRHRHRNSLAKLMGLNKWQLERRIAGQPLARVKRESRPGVESPEDVVIRHARNLGVPCDLLLARRLLTQFGGVRAARSALDQMVRAKQREAA